jgi:hypothetical protein
MKDYKKEVRPGDPNIPDLIEEGLSLYQILDLVSSNTHFTSTVMRNMLAGKLDRRRSNQSCRKRHDVTLISVDVESQENLCTIFYRKQKTLSIGLCDYEHPVEFSSKKLMR